MAHAPGQVVRGELRDTLIVGGDDVRPERDHAAERKQRQRTRTELLAAGVPEAAFEMAGFPPPVAQRWTGLRHVRRENIYDVEDIRTYVAKVHAFAATLPLPTSLK